MTPGAAVEAMRVKVEIDVRDILPSVRVPTLVIRNDGDPIVGHDTIRYLADHIPGARYVVLPGCDHFAWREEDGVTQACQEFLTGERAMPEMERILAMILLTEIVRSTDRGIEIGDHKWRELLNRHDTLVERLLNRFRGRLVDKTGDGILATFDGPARAIRCATQLTESIKRIGVEIRAGIHNGEVGIPMPSMAKCRSHG